MAIGSAAIARIQRQLAALPRSGASPEEIFRESIRQLRPYAGCDGWCGLTMDPATLLQTGGVHEHGLIPTAIRRLLEIEHGEEDVNLLSDLARRSSPVGVLSEAVSGNLLASVRYRDVLRPSGYEHELRALARSASRTWGALVMFREPRQPDFNADEKRLLQSLSAPIAEAIRASLLVAASAQASLPAGRAVIIVGPRNQPESMSANAAKMLEELSEFGPPDVHGVPHTVQVIANETRRLGAEPETSRQVVQSRARSRSGQWITLHGTLLGAQSERVAVLLEPSRPLEIASLVLDAYGLTQREGELVHYVLQGFDTEQIAELLGISTYTVQDHLKSVFDKVGVSSRKQLVSRVFFKHYLPHIQEGTPLGPDGSFVAPRT
jgi:DNA-binding CsgD family transcriptional regulator